MARTTRSTRDSRGSQMKNRLLSQPQQGKSKRNIMLPADGGGFRNGGKPSVAIWNRALRDSHVLALDLLGDGARFAFADVDAVYRFDRRDLGGGSRKEQLVGDVEK